MQSSERSIDRKGISGYRFISFCKQCWDTRVTEQEKKEREEKQMLALRNKKLEKMMKYVRGIHSTERTPIRYAVEKLLREVKSVKNYGNAPRWYQRHIIYHLSEDLHIVKVQNKFMCNKQRVDAMDFKVWYFHKDLDVTL